MTRLSPRPEAPIPRPWALRGDDPAPSVPDPDATAESDLERARPARLVCRACGHAITTTDAATSVNGATDHVCENPHGYVFRVRCFTRAPGAAQVGAPTLDHTWFAGYGWQISLCGACKVHIGWAFTAEAHRFWGLLPSGLVEVEDDAAG